MEGKQSESLKHSIFVDGILFQICDVIVLENLF